MARFASVEEEDIATLLSSKDSANTKKATNNAVGVLKFYLLEKGQPTDFLSLSVCSLRDLLKKFYVEARKKDKQQYSKSSLTAIRFGLCRFIKNSRPEIDIINRKEFEEANRVFKAKVVDLKRQGLAKIEHKPPIT